MRTSVLFKAKNFGFFKIYGVSARTKGWRQCRHFTGMGGDQFFAIFCADSFMDDLMVLSHLR